VLHYVDMSKAGWIFWGLLLFFCTALAADYQIKTVKVLPIESYPARTELDGLTFAADPYWTDEKSYTAFDIRDLNSRGYFAIHLIVKNATANYLTVKTRDIQLVTASGQPLYTLSAVLVVDDVVKSGLVSKLPKMKSHDQSTSTQVGSPLSDFTTKEFTNRLIEPGTVSDGFLFFYTAEPKKNPFAGARLVIPQLAYEGSRQSLGPASIPLDPALK
jgi:hypothetical protein